MAESLDPKESFKGGKGSFSYSDTSAYGPPAESVFGGGGGARVNKTLRFGSRAPGYKPKGVVVVRIFK